MSIMRCNECRILYGPTILVCPKCGSGNVGRAWIEPSGQGSPQQAGEDVIDVDESGNVRATGPRSAQDLRELEGAVSAIPNEAGSLAPANSAESQATHQGLPSSPNPSAPSGVREPELIVTPEYLLRENTRLRQQLESIKPYAHNHDVVYGDRHSWECLGCVASAYFAAQQRAILQAAALASPAGEKEGTMNDLFQKYQFALQVIAASETSDPRKMAKEALAGAVDRRSLSDSEAFRLVLQRTITVLSRMMAGGDFSRCSQVATQDVTILIGELRGALTAESRPPHGREPE